MLVIKYERKVNVLHAWLPRIVHKLNIGLFVHTLWIKYLRVSGFGGSET